MLIFPLFLNFGSLRFSAHSFPFETCQCNWLTQRGIGSLNMASPSVSLDLGEGCSSRPQRSGRGLIRELCGLVITLGQHARNQAAATWWKKLIGSLWHKVEEGNQFCSGENHTQCQSKLCGAETRVQPDQYEWKSPWHWSLGTSSSKGVLTVQSQYWLQDDTGSSLGHPSFDIYTQGQCATAQAKRTSTVSQGAQC